MPHAVMETAYGRSELFGKRYELMGYYVQGI